MIDIGNQEIKMLDAEELTPNSWNPNSVGVENMEKLKTSVQNNGFFKPVLYRLLENGTREIIGGEHRILAAGELGLKVPTISLGTISDAMAKKLTLMDNDSYGENDTSLIAKVLKDIEADGMSITDDMTYSEDELSELLNLTVDVDFDELDMLDDLDLDTPAEKPDVSSSEDESVFKTIKLKVDISESEEFQDAVDEALKRHDIDDSDPAVARALLFKELLDNDAE